MNILAFELEFYKISDKVLNGKFLRSLINFILHKTLFKTMENLKPSNGVTFLNYVKGWVFAIYSENPTDKC